MASVMIVDDDVNLQKGLAMVLSIGGHTIVGQAYNGVEAVEMFSHMNPKPDIILMDYRMPVMNGASATKSIIGLDPNSKILFISADYTVAAEVIELGALEFLTKPIRSKELLDIIEKHVFPHEIV